jgi:hypothetical protein
MKDSTNKKKLYVDVNMISNDLIFSPVDSNLELGVYTPMPETLSLKKYEELNLEFVNEGVQYKRQCLLKGMAREWQVQIKWHFEDAYKLLINVSNSLLLNELEIVFWSILLKSKAHTVTDTHYLAYFTGYLAKWNLNSDITPFEFYLNTLIPNFRLSFYNWQLVSDISCEITMKEIASKYNSLLLISGKSHKDYESMVGMLMQIPRRKASTISESYLSEVSVDDQDHDKDLEGYEIELLEEAKLSPIDKFED